MSNRTIQTTWTGRIDEDKTSLRYHQVVKETEIERLEDPKKKAFSLIGFACEEGLIRNLGSPGSALAPEAIKRELAIVPYHIKDDVELVDVGNVSCMNHHLEKAQDELGESVYQLLGKKYIPIIIGGGHETFYGHYLGARKFIGEEASLGMINIDAHFDLREGGSPTSGSMFRQVLEKDDNAGYLCLGIQELGGTKTLFDAAEKYNCEYITEEDITQFDKTFEVIDDFVKRHDFIIFTLCMDVVISSEAPGVNAPSPFGLEVKDVRKLLRYIAAKENVLSFDISEVNPLQDHDNKTTKLSAYYLAEVMQNFNQNIGE